MSRYIDADGFFETFSELDIVPYNTYPSTDVRENVNGEWKVGEYRGFWCSVCEQDHEYKTPYCPNCGAQMEVDE